MSAPKFEPLVTAPSASTVVSNFNATDVFTLAGLTAVSFPIGYAMGKPVRRPASAVAGGLGLVAGFFLAYQNSAGRLMGHRR